MIDGFYGESPEYYIISYGIYSIRMVVRGSIYAALPKIINYIWVFISVKNVNHYS